MCVRCGKDVDGFYVVHDSTPYNNGSGSKLEVTPIVTSRNMLSSPSQFSRGEWVDSICQVCFLDMAQSNQEVQCPKCNGVIKNVHGVVKALGGASRQDPELQASRIPRPAAFPTARSLQEEENKSERYESEDVAGDLPEDTERVRKIRPLTRGRILCRLMCVAVVVTGIVGGVLFLLHSRNNAHAERIVAMLERKGLFQFCNSVKTACLSRMPAL